MRRRIEQKRKGMATDLESLIAAARRASENAYCKYSRFPVGAALLTESGATYAGCNVENASLGLSICAERSAVFQMVAAGQRAVDTLVIYTPTATPTPPCGACRQVIHEFARKSRIICTCDGPDRIDLTLDELMPAAFGAGD